MQNGNKVEVRVCKMWKKNQRRTYHANQIDRYKYVKINNKPRNWEELKKNQSGNTVRINNY